MIGHAPNSRAKFPRKKHSNVLVNLLIKGNKSREKENSRLLEHEAYSITGISLIYHSFYALSRELYVLKYRDSLAYLVVYNWCKTTLF